ncbi:MAG: type II toxin-antitoxin system VapC family toxin [Candidatus Omnitrophica bacterium]|nr:type II toxin-antitoxin system VapC family toxin [Candidatus Omnitrophota bacterium]
MALLVAETCSRRALEILNQDSAIITWWGSPLECVSALSRRERESTLGAELVEEALGRLLALQQGWMEVDPTDKVRNWAKRLLRLHPLRAADALQLVAAVVATDQEPGRLEFACADARLAAIARREGFPVLNLMI